MTDTTTFLELLGISDQDPAWRAHPSFAGVAMRDLLTAADSHGQVSSHLVRIGPGCGLGRHTHPANGEVHHVLAGAGSAQVEQAEFDYRPGVVVHIPQGRNHAVTAGELGMLMLVVFTPALG